MQLQTQLKKYFRNNCGKLQKLKLSLEVRQNCFELIPLDWLRVPVGVLLR